MTNLQTRVVSAIVLAIPVLALTWLGGTWFRVLAAVIALVILYEWLLISGRLQWRSGLVPFAGLAAGFLLLVAGRPETIVFGILAAGLLATALEAAFRGDGRATSAGYAYAALSGVALAELRGDGLAGLWTILFLFATVWATDILAYFVGRAVGGPKLAPSISPGKTWSGAVGGAVGGTVAGLSVAAAVGHFHMALVPLAAVISVAAQIGDLFESAVKRRHGVKDSSQLIPGHGGVMDRVDGLVAAAILLYLVLIAAGGFDDPAMRLFPV
ncbi:MAG: phosphatidate cytidylyltransferase [Rhizobiaceae bacterium]